VLFWIVLIDGHIRISCENSVSEDMYDYWVASP